MTSSVIISLLLSSLLVKSTAAFDYPFRDPSLTFEERVDDLRLLDRRYLYSGITLVLLMTIRVVHHSVVKHPGTERSYVYFNCYLSCATL